MDIFCVCGLSRLSTGERRSRRVQRQIHGQSIRPSRRLLRYSGRPYETDLPKLLPALCQMGLLWLTAGSRRLIDMTTAGAPSMDIHLTASDLEQALERDVRQGLEADQKWLPPVWFYDDKGSELFDEITRLPEYYLTRAERRLLESHAKEIATRWCTEVLVELGAGTCEKSRILLDALTDAGTLKKYVPLDVSDNTLFAAATSLADTYPTLSVHAVVGDFGLHMTECLPMEDGWSSFSVAP